MLRTNENREKLFQVTEIGRDTNQKVVLWDKFSKFNTID